MRVTGCSRRMARSTGNRSAHGPHVYEPELVDAICFTQPSLSDERLMDRALLTPTRSQRSKAGPERRTKCSPIPSVRNLRFRVSRKGFQKRGREVAFKLRDCVQELFLSRRVPDRHWKGGQTIGRADPLIGGIALTQPGVVTGNTKHGEASLSAFRYRWLTGEPDSLNSSPTSRRGRPGGSGWMAGWSRGPGLSGSRQTWAGVKDDPAHP